MKWHISVAAVIAASLFLTLSGCGKKNRESSAKTPDPMMLVPAQEDPNAAADLENLNKALREYVGLKKVIPTDLTELVRSGMTRSLPVPPPGKKFVILHHALGYQVVLADK